MLNCDFPPSDRLLYRTEETKGHLHDGYVRVAQHTPHTYTHILVLVESTSLGRAENTDTEDNNEQSFIYKARLR